MNQLKALLLLRAAQATYLYKLTMLGTNRQFSQVI